MPWLSNWLAKGPGTIVPGVGADQGPAAAPSSGTIAVATQLEGRLQILALLR
jgi:hypothetical protein